MKEIKKEHGILMNELYQASHHDLYNLCIVLGAMITHRCFEEKGRGDVETHGKEMTEDLVHMLVANLEEVRQGTHLTSIQSPLSS